jgi:transcriptional regulator with XRE-family HTH domain
MEVDVDLKKDDSGSIKGVMDQSLEILGDEGGSKVRVKSSNRIYSEAQVSVIKANLGGLEDIRKSLGLSQRKICQLLLVDPSAWSRWIDEGCDAPPHIYRSLQWYLALEDKLPGLSPYLFLQKNASEDTVRLLEKRVVENQLEAQKLKAELEAMKTAAKKTKQILLALLATVSVAVLFHFFTR